MYVSLLYLSAMLWKAVNMTINLFIFQDMWLAVCHPKLVLANFELKHLHRKIPKN